MELETDDPTELLHRLTGEALNGRSLREVHQHIAGDGRADDLPIERQRRADNGEAVGRRKNHRIPILDLREALPSAFDQNVRCVTVLFEQGNEGS